MTTVTAVRRALEEFAAMPPADVGYYPTGAARTLAENPTAVTIIANRLSDRGEAGNLAVQTNLAALEKIKNLYLGATTVFDDVTADEMRIIVRNVSALEWAIDQLTPP